MATKQSKYVPPHASHHVAVPIGDKLYRWGGRGSEQRRNMVDMFDVKKEQWECLNTRGPPPPGIEDCVYTVIGSSLFTFGGRDGRSHYNSLHQLDTKTMEWRELVPRNPSDAPQKKNNCGMVSLDDDKLVVFAGYTGHKNTDELHVFDTKKMTWTPQPTTGRKPPPLSLFTFTKIDATRASVFGGFDGTNRNDVYILDLRKWEWALLHVSGRPKPSVRSGHAACCLAGPLTGQEHPLLVVVGGLSDGSKVLDDVWLLDIDGRRWKQVALPEAILPRWHHTATVFGAGPGCRHLVLWGGSKDLWGDSIGETTLLNFDLTRREWKVTSVVKEDQLGRPEERLRKKMERLWPHTPTRAAASQEERLRREEQRARESEDESRRLQAAVRDANRRAQDAETRAQQMEQRARDETRRLQAAVRDAEDRASAEVRAAQTRAKQMELRATQAEETTHVLQQRITDAEIQARRSEDEAQRHIREAAGRLADTEERLRQAEERAAAAEERNRVLLGERRTQDERQFWVVQRGEIELTAQELGRGGWAVVRVAKFRGLRVAAKCLHTLIISDYNRHLFTREMNIAATVRHPNLIQFMGATVVGEPIILTELMATSLRAVLERRPFNPPQITSIGLDVARALNYLHLMKPDPIIHRDISSANVLLDPALNDTWRAKVSDYGSANFLQRVATVGPGNPTYAAPEANDPSRQSPKMDVYSYGVLLLETCSRRFPDSTDRDALFQLVQQPTMVGLIRQCLEHDPNRRPTMSAVIEQLEEQ